MGRLLAIVGWLCGAGQLACGSPTDGREPFPGAWSPLGAPGQRIVHLSYADGNEVPTPALPCNSHTPPAYTCAFAASPVDCQAAVQVHLARWYERFDVHFTVVPPPSSVPHDTLVITSNGDWCGPVPGGLAPATCEALAAGTAWAFDCGESAQTCAAVIAQEHAHLLGLEHTDSPSDVMFNPVSAICRGFEDSDNGVVAGRCRRRQNSFALMRERLGARDQGERGGVVPTAVEN
jgi:hypothetical protein